MGDKLKRSNLPWLRKICGGIECHGMQTTTVKHDDSTLGVIEGCVFEYDAEGEKVMVANLYGDMFTNEDGDEFPVMEYKISCKCRNVKFNYPLFMAMIITLKALGTKKPPITPHLRKSGERGRGVDFDIFLAEVYELIILYTLLLVKIN